VVSQIPSNYQDNFNTKFKDMCAMRDKAIKDNQQIYFERDFPDSSIPKPDQQNFVKLEPVNEDVKVSHPIEQKLRHIVPPQVRQMQEELRAQLQEIVNQQMEQVNKNDASQRQFLQTNGLPHSLHSLTSTNELPAEVWDKIEDF